MTIETTHTISAVDEADVATDLVFTRVEGTLPPPVTPYSVQITMTIGDKVYTFNTSDLLELSRRVAGT